MQWILVRVALNIINFDAVDFSSRRSEEVIFFWRSVCYYFLLYSNVPV